MNTAQFALPGDIMDEIRNYHATILSKSRQLRAGTAASSGTPENLRANVIQSCESMEVNALKTIKAYCESRGFNPDLVDVALQLMDEEAEGFEHPSP